MAPFDGSKDALRCYIQKYTYDEVGNILELKHIAGGGSTGGYTRTYDYGTAATSNRLQSTTVGNNNPYSYSYDARGNMTAMPHLDKMDYDALNQMRRAEDAAGTMEAYYQYSGGQRIRKYVVKGNNTEQRIYIGGWELYRRRHNSHTEVERMTVHVSDGQGRIAMLEVRSPDSDDDGYEESLKRFIYSNHLGNSALELDEDGDVISYEEYHPYGTTAYQAMNSDIAAVAKRYRFTGKERDEESGLNYHGARYYVPWLARWCAVDPLESKYAGLSPYNYCANNPVMYHDPDGASFVIKKTTTDSTATTTPCTDTACAPAPVSASVTDTATAAAKPVSQDVVSSAGPANTQSAAAPAASSEAEVVYGGQLDGPTVTARKKGFWNGVARFGKGFIEGAADAIKGTVEFAVNIFRFDGQNSLFQVAKGLYNIAAHPVDTYNGVKAALKSVDWSDPKSYGKIAGNLTVNLLGPGAIAKGAKVLSEAAGLTRALEASGEMASLGRGGEGLAATTTLATPGAVAGSTEGSIYSVAFEMKLPKTEYPGVYRGSHFKTANEALNDAMKADASFSEAISNLGISIPRSPAGTIVGKSPTNWVWHHHIDEGIMQLVPKYQHTVGSSFWKTLHPGGIGGFAKWGR